MAVSIEDRFLSGRAAHMGMTNPTLDPSIGGQLGYDKDLRFWVNNANLKQINLIPILIEGPAAWRYLNNAEKRYEILRAMVELHPRSIEGLDATLNVAVDGTPVSGDGQTQQEFVNVTREVSQPTFVWDDKYGRPIGLTLEDWVLQTMADPATKVANIITQDGQRPTDMLPDNYTMTMLFIEPDPTHRHVIKAFLCTNMFPQGKIADYTARRDVTQSMNLVQYSQQFTALTTVGAGVNQVAQSVLDGIQFTGANPNMRAAFIREISKDVLAASNTGFAAGVASVASNNITR